MSLWLIWIAVWILTAYGAFLVGRAMRTKPSRGKDGRYRHAPPKEDDVEVEDKGEEL